MTMTLTTPAGVVISFGTPKGEAHDLDCKLEVFAMPISGSKYNMVTDYNGVERVIRIRGTYEDTDANIMDNFVLKIEAITDGNQITNCVFHSDKYDAGTGQTGNFNVKVDKFHWDWDEEVVGRITYTLTMFEGV